MPQASPAPKPRYPCLQTSFAAAPRQMREAENGRWTDSQQVERDVAFWWTPRLAKSSFRRAVSLCLSPHTLCVVFMRRYRDAATIRARETERERERESRRERRTCKKGGREGDRERERERENECICSVTKRNELRRTKYVEGLGLSSFLAKPKTRERERPTEREREREKKETRPYRALRHRHLPWDVPRPMVVDLDDLNTRTASACGDEISFDSMTHA